MVINGVLLREYKPPAEVSGLLLVPNSGYLACLDISPCLFFLFLLAFQGLFMLSLGCDFQCGMRLGFLGMICFYGFLLCCSFFYLKGCFNSH